MEFSFVALHQDCPRLDITSTPPKFAFEGAVDEGGNTLRLRCSLCGKVVHLTIDERPEEADDPDHS